MRWHCNCVELWWCIEHTWSVGSLSLCCLMMYLVPTTISFRFDILFIRVVVIGIEFSRDVILALLSNRKKNHQCFAMVIPCVIKILYHQDFWLCIPLASQMDSLDPKMTTKVFRSKHFRCNRNTKHLFYFTQPCAFVRAVYGFSLFWEWDQKCFSSLSPKNHKNIHTR